MKHSFTADSLHVYMGKKVALWDISFQIPTGVIVGVLGPNGAGKSTLFKTALEIVTPISGKIEILESSISDVKKKVCYIPQKESIDWDFPITAEEVVLMGRYRRMGLFGRPRKADFQAAHHAMERLGILPLAKMQISELSGGQQQRLFVARALLQEEAEVFLLDEPFSGIDIATEEIIIELLKEQKKKGKTIFIIHHDLNTVDTYFDWTILLNTRLISCGPTKVAATKELLNKAFGRKELLFDEAAHSLAKTLTGAP